MNSSAPLEPFAVRPSVSRDGRLAAALIGLAMGGFFDGILLHQILQWHHLLSAVTTGAFAELRTQILFDGVFHLLMYGVGLVGLVMLMRGRVTVSTGALCSWGLIGFGVWHLMDAVLSHWILGIHRIRTDVPDPLVWDIGWLLVFGLVPMALGGWWLRRARGSASSPGAAGGGTRALIALVTIGAAGAGLWPASVEADGSRYLTVVLREHPQALLRSLSHHDARVVWNDPAGQVWVLQAPADLNRWSLYRHGALLVSGTLLPAGCNAWRN
jgi:uncharacterized membrane protein